MPSTQVAAGERRNDRTLSPHANVTNEPPKLKTTYKTPPKQATNPLQFVKVGPCSLYRTAQEQLQKVQEVKKIKQEIRDDPEDWQSNLDNWKSSRRKRQEHIIERVVEVKKLELEDHDRQRRRSKTFSEMMEERGQRGRKLSISLAMYNEEDANDLSDLGIGTSSGKSSISGDTHDDTVLSDRESEIEKNPSDTENGGQENGNDRRRNGHDGGDRCKIDNDGENSGSNNNNGLKTPASQSMSLPEEPNELIKNRYSKNNSYRINGQESMKFSNSNSTEPKECTYDGTDDSPVLQNIRSTDPQLSDNSSSFLDYKSTCDNSHNFLIKSEEQEQQPVKIDIGKRREIFEKASREQQHNKNGDAKLEFSSGISIKERLSNLERQKTAEIQTKLALSPQSVPSTHTEHESKQQRALLQTEELEGVKSLRSKLFTSENLADCREPFNISLDQNELCIASIKDRLTALDRYNESDRHSTLLHQQASSREENTNWRERSSSPDYQAPRANQSQNSLDASSKANKLVEIFEALERPTTLEILNETDIQDSDASCSIEHRDEEPIEEENSRPEASPVEENIEIIEKLERHSIHSIGDEEKISDDSNESRPHCELTEPTKKGTDDFSCSTLGKSLLLIKSSRASTNASSSPRSLSSSRPVVYQSPRIPPRRRPPDDSQHPVKSRSSTEAAGRSPSKIPTRASRNQPTSSPPESPPRQTAPCSSLAPCRLSEIPVKVSCSHSPRMLPTDTRRHTVLEVCEKPENREAKETKETVHEAARPTSLHLESINSLSLSNYPSAELPSPLSAGKQILPLSFSSDEEVVVNISFPLGPPTSVEPPNEKPPPPPVLSDEENQPIEPLKRLNSTRRIKKELRTRRSDFLGIEGFNEDDLERELELAKPPDMAAILAEERRIEQLQRRSYDTDSNYEQDSSHERDSGVELGQDWSKQPVSPDMSQHSRQSSEPFGASVTSSEEDELGKKEREIIQLVEREEQWRYQQNRSDIGEKLAHKLRELEEDKLLLECANLATSEPQPTHSDLFVETLQRMNEENLRKQELGRKEAQRDIVDKLIKGEEKLQENSSAAKVRRHQDANENKSASPSTSDNTHKEDDYGTREVLRVERELLQLEQEELKRQRNNLAYREQKQQQLAEKLAEQLQEQWKSLQDVGAQSAPRQSFLYKQSISNYRSSMPNLQESAPLAQKRRPPPPPIPPTKPLRLVEQRQLILSHISSVDSIPQQMETPPTASNASNAQKMSRQTLQALSAVPRPRIVLSDQWVQRRKSDIPRGAADCNYQHWLIQEAEQRRINEQNQRSAPIRKQHVTAGTSVPYSSTPPRSKPLPDSIIQTLTQRVQNRAQPPRRRLEHSTSQEQLYTSQQYSMQHKTQQEANSSSQEKMLSVSGKKKCSHCGDELGRGAAMIIESLRLFYHMECFKCCVCHVRLGDGLMGTDVRVRNHKLHCHNCYSSDDGVKFSCV